MAGFLSMGVPHIAGIFQARMNKGDVGLDFNTHWAGFKVASKESKGSVRLSCNVFDVVAPSNL